MDNETMKEQLYTKLPAIASGRDSNPQPAYYELHTRFKILYSHYLHHITKDSFNLLHQFSKTDKAVIFTEYCYDTIIDRPISYIQDSAEYKRTLAKQSSKARESAILHELDRFFAMVGIKPIIPRIITGNPILDNCKYEIGINNQTILLLTKNDCITLLSNFNGLNRPVTKSNVKAFKEKLIKNEYSEYVEHVKAIADGKYRGHLADGQHRMEAFIDTDGIEYLRCMLSTIPEKDLKKLDTGKSRNEAEKAIITSKLNFNNAIPEKEIKKAIKYRRQLIEIILQLSNANTSTFPVIEAMREDPCSDSYLHNFWSHIRDNMNDRCVTAPLTTLNKNITYAFMSLLEFSVELPNKDELIDKFQNLVSSTKYKKLPHDILHKFNKLCNESNLNEYIATYKMMWNHICAYNITDPLAHVDVDKISLILRINNVVKKANFNNKHNRYKRKKIVKSSVLLSDSDDSIF